MINYAYVVTYKATIYAIWPWHSDVVMASLVSLAFCFGNFLVWWLYVAISLAKNSYYDVALTYEELG